MQGQICEEANEGHAEESQVIHIHTSQYCTHSHVRVGLGVEGSLPPVNIKNHAANVDRWENMGSLEVILMHDSYFIPCGTFKFFIRNMLIL